MNNMFSGKSEKQIPKNLNECTQPDATVTNLHIWSERVENLGQILFKILIILGIVMAIISLFQTSYDEGTAIYTFLSTSATWALYAFIEYCTYHVVALLISALASITQSTLISSNIALYEASKNESISEFTQEMTHISTVSKSTQETATIGDDHINHETYSPIAEQPDDYVISPDVWVCRNCGVSNSINYGQCKKCGQYRSS